MSPGGTLRVLRVGGAPPAEYAPTTTGDEPPAVPADPLVDDLPGGQDLQAEQGGPSGLPEGNVPDPQPQAGQPGPARPLPVDLPDLYTTSFGKVYHRRSTMLYLWQVEASCLCGLPKVEPWCSGWYLRWELPHREPRRSTYNMEGMFRVWRLGFFSPGNARRGSAVVQLAHHMQ